MSESQLQGKVAVITGGNSGIGLATAKLFREQGARVVVTARSSETFATAKSEFGDFFDVVQVDVTSVDEVQNLSQYVKSRYGEIDIVFANAGVARFLPLQEVTEGFYDSIFNTNVKGLFFTVQKLSPLVRRGGSIILTTSALNTKGVTGATVYGAIRSMARSLARELSEQGVRVNALSPGPVQTPIYDKLEMSQKQREQFEASVTSMTPMRRFAEPQEIAHAALFLASESSSFLLGSELVADGGYSQL